MSGVTESLGVIRRDARSRRTRWLSIETCARGRCSTVSCEQWLGRHDSLTSCAEEGIVFKKIDHVEIVTDQLDRTVEFYTDVLGFKLKARDRIDRSSLGVPLQLVYHVGSAGE